MTIDPVLIKSSIAVVEPHGTEVTAWFYRHLFEHNPGVRPLFADHLDEQQDRLWETLGALVTHLATLAHFAGDAWTPETEAAWTSLYGADTMGKALTAAGPVPAV